MTSSVSDEDEAHIGPRVDRRVDFSGRGWTSSQPGWSGALTFIQRKPFGGAGKRARIGGPVVSVLGLLLYLPVWMLWSGHGALASRRNG
jgi:hypothetical protein